MRNWNKIIASGILLTLLISCGNSEVKEKPKVTPPKVENEWNLLEIEVDEELIWILRNQDTCFYRKKSADEAYRRIDDMEYRREDGRFVLSKKMRDSLFVLGEDAITNFVPSKEFLTCYAGKYVRISLDKSISCNYSSIGNWTKVSKTLFKISEIAFREVEKQQKK